MAHRAFSLLRRHIKKGSVLACGVVFCLTACRLAAADTAPTRPVLMLLTEGKDLPVNDRVKQAKAELQNHSTNRIEFCAEHLDASRFPGEGYFNLFRKYLREKYVRPRPDLVMAFLARGFGMAGELPTDVFPDMRGVFVWVNELEMPGQSHLARTLELGC